MVYLIAILSDMILLGSLLLSSFLVRKLGGTPSRDKHTKVWSGEGTPLNFSASLFQWAQTTHDNFPVLYITYLGA